MDARLEKIRGLFKAKIIAPGVLDDIERNGAHYAALLFGEVERLEAEVARLRAALAERGREIGRLRAERVEAAEDYVGVSGELSGTEAEVTVARAELAEAKADGEKHYAEIERMAVRINELRAELAAALGERERYRALLAEVDADNVIEPGGGCQFCGRLVWDGRGHGTHYEDRHQAGCWWVRVTAALALAPAPPATPITTSRLDEVTRWYTFPEPDDDAPPPAGEYRIVPAPLTTISGALSPEGEPPPEPAP